MHHKTLILGEFDLLINKAGLRAACKRSGITFVAQAPAWRAVAFSTRSGAIWRPAPVKFRPVHEQWNSLAVIGLPGIWLIPVVRTGQGEISGFKCVSFATSDQWVRQQAGQLTN